MEGLLGWCITSPEETVLLELAGQCRSFELRVKTRDPEQEMVLVRCCWGLDWGVCRGQMVGNTGLEIEGG